jgi:apolipoprotein N-acyltransferase
MLGTGLAHKLAMGPFTALPFPFEKATYRGDETMSRMGLRYHPRQLATDGLSSFHSSQPFTGKIVLFCVRSVLVSALAACLAWSWIDQGSYWLGWLGLGGFLYFNRYALERRTILWPSLYSLVALGIAFHWAPAAMAYTMDASLSLATVVVIPILSAEVVRLALPFIMPGPRKPSQFVMLLPTWVWLAAFAVALETVVPAVFPWRLGYLQSGAPLLNQLVPLLGPGITTVSAFAMAALVCGVLALLSRVFLRAPFGMGLVHFERKEIWTAAGFVGLNLAWGAACFYTWQHGIQGGRSLNVALVQVDPSYVESLEKMQRLTRRAGTDVDLVCWPESSLGCYAEGVQEFTDRKYLRQNSRGPLRGKRPLVSPSSELLAGGRSYTGPRDEDGGESVSAYLVDRQERIIGRYDKTRLMPFGEFVPGAQAIPALVTLFGFGAEPPSTGERARALTASCGARLGVMMCYEDMIPDVSRALIDDGAEVLIALINGTAFENSITLRQHRQLASFRALENRRYLLRTASTGSTCVIDPLGRCVAELPVQTEDLLEAQVTLLQGKTLFNHTGDVFGWTCVALSGLYLFRSLEPRLFRKSSRRGGSYFPAK